MSFLRVIHRWIGLVLAAVVLLVAVSGGLLLLREPYYHAVYPSLAAPITPGERAGYAGIVADVEARWGGEGIRLVKFPRPGVNAFQVWFADGTEAFVDPHSGALIDRWHWSERVPAFLFELHAHLFAEESGTFVNGVVALFTVFMTLTGVVLWWPRRQGAFRLRQAVPRGTSAAELLRSHAAVGALAALPIALFAATGAAIVFYDETSAVMTALFDARDAEQPTARVEPTDAPHRPWSEVLAALDRTFPEGDTVFYYPGTATNARLLFRKTLPGEWHPNGRSYVLVDPYTATVVQAIDARAQGAGTRAMHAVYPLHAAKAGGAAMVALAALAALALSWLAGGGVWAYVARRFFRTRRARVALTSADAQPARS